MIPRLNAVDSPESWVVLARSAVSIVVPADTTEDILAVIQLPAGLLGANGWLSVETLWSFTSSANTKTPRARIGGPAGTDLIGASWTTGTTGLTRTNIAARNAQNSQLAQTEFVSTSADIVSFLTTTAIDLSAASSIVISGQKQSGAEAFTLLGYKALFCQTA